MMPEAANDSLFVTGSRDSRIGMRDSESNSIFQIPVPGPESRIPDPGFPTPGSRVPGPGFRIPDPGSRDSCVIVCS